MFFKTNISNESQNEFIIKIFKFILVCNLAIFSPTTTFLFTFYFKQFR